MKINRIFFFLEKQNDHFLFLGFDFERILHLIYNAFFIMFKASNSVFCIDFSKNSLLSYVSILISGDRDKLRLWEGESLHPAGLACVLGSVLVNLHHMQARLIFMQ